MGLIHGGDLDNAIVILEKEVEQSEIDRIAKLFNRPGINAIQQEYLIIPN